MNTTYHTALPLRYSMNKQPRPLSESLLIDTSNKSAVDRFCCIHFQEQERPEQVLWLYPNGHVCTWLQERPEQCKHGRVGTKSSFAQSNSLRRIWSGSSMRCSRSSLEMTLIPIEPLHGFILPLCVSIPLPTVRVQRPYRTYDRFNPALAGLAHSSAHDGFDHG